MDDLEHSVRDSADFISKNSHFLRLGDDYDFKNAAESIQPLIDHWKSEDWSSNGLHPSHIDDHKLKAAWIFLIDTLNFAFWKPPGTEKRDRGIKKNLYEICGVKEYWLANPEIKSVEVYLLIDQKFYLDEVYRIFPDYIRLSETEKEQYKTNVKVSLYDDFYIPLSTIFLNVK